MTEETILQADESLIIKPYYGQVLADSLCNNDVFYVGEGKSQRGFDYLQEALNPDIADTSRLAVPCYKYLLPHSELREPSAALQRQQGI